MACIEPIEPEHATGKGRELLDELASRGGEPRPMVRAMATALALLRGHLDLNRAMKRRHLVSRIGERIAEVVGLLALQQLTGAFNLVAGIHPPATARSAA